MKYLVLTFLIAGLMAEQSVNDGVGTGTGSNTLDNEANGEQGTLSTDFPENFGIPVPVEGDGSGEVDRELTETEKLALGFEKQTVQPDWIRRFGIVSDDVRSRVTLSEDFDEVVSPNVLVAFDSENDNRKHEFVISFQKASDWMFVTFTDADTQVKHEFFFPYTALVENDTVYLRELLEECLKPETHEPSPPTIAKCHYFYKKVSEAYDFAVKEVGPVEGADLMECYIESVKKMTRQPRVEILCVEGGIEDAQYRELTREQYDHIKANYNDDGNGLNYTGDLEETKVTRVNAK
jgi:hypothetical protein